MLDIWSMGLLPALAIAVMVHYFDAPHNLLILVFMALIWPVTLVVGILWVIRSTVSIFYSMVKG